VRGARPLAIRAHTSFAQHDRRRDSMWRPNSGRTGGTRRGALAVGWIHQGIVGLASAPLRRSASPVCRIRVQAVRRQGALHNEVLPSSMPGGFNELLRRISAARSRHPIASSIRTATIQQLCVKIMQPSDGQQPTPYQYHRQQSRPTRVYTHYTAAASPATSERESERASEGNSLNKEALRRCRAIVAPGGYAGHPATVTTQF
jgi:hypothetical protein